MCDGCPLDAFTTEPTSELHVFGLNGGPLGVDSTNLRILEQGTKVRFSGFL